VKKAYDAAPRKTQKRACQNLTDLIDGFDSWDMNQIKDLSWTPDKTDLSYLFCAHCRGSVTYKNQCVSQSVLNYTFLGYAASLCEFEYDELQTLKGLIGLGFYVRGTGSNPDNRNKLDAIDEGYEALGGTSRMSPTSDCNPSKRKVGIGRAGWESVDPSSWKWEGLSPQ